jgi:S1-C subfamily serine protease
MVHDIIYKIDSFDEQLIFTESGPQASTQTRRSFKVTLGIIPSYGSEVEGLEIDGARADGPGGKAGLKKGDIIIEIGGKDIKNIYDYMYRLGELNPGESINIKVRRGDRIIDLKVNL